MLLLLSLLGCPTPSDCPGVADAACPMAGGATFASLDERECGLGPDGEVLCTWLVRFAADGTWSWSGSDYGRSGIWTCDGDTFVIEEAETVVPASWDEETCTLTWDGVEYAVQ